MKHLYVHWQVVCLVGADALHLGVFALILVVTPGVLAAISALCGVLPLVTAHTYEHFIG